MKKRPRGKWKSFRQALKAVWGAEKLKEMQTRLDLFSQQLQQRMHAKTQESITKVQVDVIQCIETANAASTRAHNRTSEDIERLRKESELKAEQHALQLQ